MQELGKCKSRKAYKFVHKNIRKHISKENKTFLPDELTEIQTKHENIRVYRSSGYLVQVHPAKGAVARISVNKSDIKEDGNWKEGITWDRLMSIKHALGFGEHEAVEVYPKNVDVVNVANIRHLFVLEEGMPFTWKAKK